MEKEAVKLAKAFPLEWPVGYRRTAPSQRQLGAFKQTPENAQSFLYSELRRIHASDAVVSTNIMPLRQDGQMYANAMRKAHLAEDDPGVAVYFRRKGKTVVICCDYFNAVWKNVYAIAKSMEAIRMIDRYNVSDFMDRAYSGFNKLLATPYQDPWLILGIAPGSTEKDIDSAFKAKARYLHPDSGGTEHQFKDLQWARDEAKRIIKN